MNKYENWGICVNGGKYKVRGVKLKIRWAKTII